MKNLILICILGLTFTMGACAHKHGCKGGGCKDGSCKMDKKDCSDCDKKVEPAKTEEKK